MKNRNLSKSLKLPVGISVLLGSLMLTEQGLAAPLPDPGVGFEWVLVDSDTHFDSASGLEDINSQHTINGAASLGAFNTEITLDTFDPGAELTLRQTAEPGATFHICVVSSDLYASLSGSGSGFVVNFDPANNLSYDGALTLQDWQVSGAASIPETTVTATGGGIVTPFGGVPFSGGAAQQNLVYNGTGPADGSPAIINFSGDFTMNFSGSAPGTVFGNASAAMNAQITTDYEVYRLQAIPEPNIMFTIILGIGLIVLKRSRR